MNKRNFLKSLGLSLGLFPVLGMQKAFNPGSPNSQIIPGSLKKGDTLRLISHYPATAERLQFQLAKEALEALGFEVKMGENLQNRRGHLAGTDMERANDLNNMFADPEVKAIICIRGGSGAARILPLIDYKNIRQNPKPLLGYSDVTALHNAIYSKTGLITFHGPNGTGSWNSFNVKQFEKVFFEQELVKFENEQQKGDELIV
jgi:muramoyltetrapeptide carboxypeptidase